MNEYFTDVISLHFSESSGADWREVRAAGEKAEGAGDQVEVCDSVTHNVQLNVTC